MVEDYLSVSQLNRFIKDVVNSGFPQPVWVCGEIQGFDRNRDKKHIFFELVEKNAQTHEVAAKVGVVIFAQTKTAIDNILKQSGSSFSLKDDIEVKFSCRVDFYPPQGAVRLIIESIDPMYTLGKMAMERQKLVLLLRQNGTLDKNKQLELSTVTLNVGLITSYDSAAFNDFCSELKKSGLAFRIFVRNTLMQGKKTEEDVVKAMEELARIKGLDTVVITRGGGSIAELSCFDSKLIAEKIAAYHLPVLSGIGHEINTTITDLAAHTSAKTPTAIAQILIERVRGFLSSLDEKTKDLMGASQAAVEVNKQMLRNLALELQSQTQMYLKDHTEQIVRLREVIKSQPQALLKAKHKDLNTVEAEVEKCLMVRIQNTKQRIASYEKMIDLVHPVKTLKRGFTITRLKSGKIVKNLKDVALKDALVTQLHDGEIVSEVKALKE